LILFNIILYSLAISIQVRCEGREPVGTGRVEGTPEVMASYG
jgi:hypothetical protein